MVREATVTRPWLVTGAGGMLGRDLVTALDVRTGAERWRYETVAAADVQPLPSALAPFARGPSGADVWATPTYDVETSTVYIGTGQNYSPNAEGTSTPTSDAIIVTVKASRVLWNLSTFSCNAISSGGR